MSGVLANRRAFGAALITVLILLVTIELTARMTFADAEIAAWDAESFLAHERDDHGRLVSNVVSLRQQTPRTAGRIILIGGSTIREGLVPDGVVQARLDEVLALDAPSIHTLYSFDQSMIETARVALNIDVGVGDTVVIGINPRRFGFGESAIVQEFAASRLSLLDSEPVATLVAADAITDARPEQSGLTEISEAVGDSVLFAPWDLSTLFEQRLFLRQWFEGRLPGETTTAWRDVLAGRLTDVDIGALADLTFRDIRRPLRYGYGNQPLPVAEKELLAQVVANTRVDGWFDHHELDLAIARCLIDDLTGAGAEVVLLELPRSSLSVGAYGPVWSDYDAEIDALAASTGATRADLRDVPFADDEFFDLEHLLAPGRPRLTDAVFRVLLGFDLELASQ